MEDSAHPRVVFRVKGGYENKTNEIYYSNGMYKNTYRVDGKLILSLCYEATLGDIQGHSDWEVYLSDSATDEVYWGLFYKKNIINGVTRHN